MKQWFSYRNLQLPAGLSKWNPAKILEESFGSMNLSWKIGIGEGISSSDARIIGCITVDDQASADAVIEALAAFGAKRKTITEAETLLESLTGWTVTQNGDTLEATINSQDFTW